MLRHCTTYAESWNMLARCGLVLFNRTVHVCLIKWQLKKCVLPAAVQVLQVCLGCGPAVFTKPRGLILWHCRGLDQTDTNTGTLKCIPNKKDSKILQNRKNVMYSITKTCTKPKLFCICNLLLDVNIYVLPYFLINITQHMLLYKQYCIWQILQYFLIGNRMQWSIKRPRYAYEKKFSLVCRKFWLLIYVISVYNKYHCLIFFPNATF